MKTVTTDVTMKILEQDMKILERCQTIEDLVYASWQIEVHCNQHNPVIIGLKAEKELEIRYEESKDNVIQKLATALVAPMHEQDCIRKIAEEENLTMLNIPEILMLEKIANQDNKPYCACLEKLEMIVQKQIPSNRKYEIQKARRAEKAKITLEAFMNSRCESRYEFCQKTNCSMKELTSAATMLKEIDDPLYDQYRKTVLFLEQNIAQEEKSLCEKVSDHKNQLISEIRRASEEEIYSFLLHGNSDVIRTFCMIYGLNTKFVGAYLQYNRKDKAKLLASADTIEKAEILKNFQTQCFTLSHCAAKEMKQILYQEKAYQQQGSNKVAPLFDLYHFYEQCRFPFLDFISIINCIDNVECHTDAKIMHMYINQHQKLFSSMDEKKIKGLCYAKQMVCCGHRITFETSDVNNAMKDIEEKKMPKYYGVVFQAIERQKSKREAAQSNHQNPKTYVKSSH